MTRTISAIFAAIMCISMLTACNTSFGTYSEAPGTPNATTEIAFNLERETFTLNNGIEMPALGLGTFTLSPVQAEESVYNALITGVRLIDTANAYMNERAVGRGVRRSGVSRDEVFITTKLWPPDYGDAGRVWELYSTAFIGEEVIDTTYFHDRNGDKWLFLNKGWSYESELHIYKIDSLKLENIIAHKSNPVVIDCRKGRNGGAIFEYENEYYRPSQINTHGIYGKGLRISKIKKLTIDEFEDESIIS